MNSLDDRKQIVLGSLLGNGYLCRTKTSVYFSMRHSVRHKNWLDMKAAELTEFASKTPYYTNKTAVTWRSACSPLFCELRDFCYKDDLKTVTMDWLDSLRALAIAVWFGDSGCMTGRGRRNACLRTQSFGPEGNAIIERYFNEVGMPCSLNKSRKSQVVLFSIQGTQNLLALIQHCLPGDHTFKLLPALAGEDLQDDDEDLT